MRERSGRRLGALVVLAGAFALAAAATAPAEFSTAASAGPLTVSTATLPAPAPPLAVGWSCDRRGATNVVVAWREDRLPNLFSTARVSVLRADSPNGPWTAIATQEPLDGVTLDSVPGGSPGALDYAVQVTEESWQSSLSAPTQVRTGCGGDDGDRPTTTADTTTETTTAG